MVEDLAERFWLGMTCFTARQFIRGRPGRAASNSLASELRALCAAAQR